MERERPSAKRGKQAISSYFKKIDHQINEEPSVPHQSNEVAPIPSVPLPSNSSPPPHPLPPSPGSSPSKSNCIERDPAKRIQICEHPINLRDEIRRAYLLAGPYHPELLKYPSTKFGSQNRSFQQKWFQKWKWLEYSPSTNKAYCFYCFLCVNDVSSSSVSALVKNGFDNWKRVNQGNKCAFLAHVGFSPSSSHNVCCRKAEDLMRPSQHIDKVLHTQTRKEKEKNRLRLKVSIESARYLAFQGCAFRGNDETPFSLNRGNFLEMIAAFAKMNIEIDKVVLGNAPKNAQYTSPLIQKDILNIMGNRVRQRIREEVGDQYFCILVDEAQDISKREQMAIVLRYVNIDGVLTECFLAIKSVSDTTSLNLKNEITDVLVRYNLQVQNMRGQGYDGANNMRGAFNGLQALFIRECPYAYYVHCFAHRLQLTLVSAAKDVSIIWEFFSQVDNLVNIISSSPRRISELKSAHRQEIEHMLASGELTTRSGANQVCNLQRSVATRWSSHYESVKSLIDMYHTTCKVLEYLRDHSPNGRSKAEVRGVYRHIATFEFVFVLHMMHRIMRTTDSLCQSLQRKSLDILEAMGLVSSTRNILQELREDGWERFLDEVKSFCSKNDIDTPNLSCLYKEGRSKDQTTVEHPYHFDVFNEAIDFVMVELDTRFNETSVELLCISVALDPKNEFESYNSGDICKLAKKFYPEDFSNQDIYALEYELKHFELNVITDPQFKVSTLSELCEKLVESRKSETYTMFTRLIYLVLTLPVSTASTERAFSAMKFIKTSLRNKMEDEFLGDCMTLFVEREFGMNIDVESIIDEFYTSKSRRAQLM